MDTLLAYLISHPWRCVGWALLVSMVWHVGQLAARDIYDGAVARLGRRAALVWAISLWLAAVAALLIALRGMGVR